MYTWHEEDLLPRKHRSHVTEADRTDQEWGYRPDCGHWYEMMAGQHRG